MASFRQNIKIFNEIAKKKGLVQGKSLSFPRDSKSYMTIADRPLTRSSSCSRADNTLVTTNFKKYTSNIFNNFPTLLTNTNTLQTSVPSRNYAKDYKGSKEKCDSPCPKKETKPREYQCRKAKSCSELPVDLCECNPPRHFPKPLKNVTKAKCPPRSHEKQLSCTSIKIPLPGCVLPTSTNCLKFVKRAKCQKPEAPQPSYSECIKPAPPPMLPTECALSTRRRYLQPSVRILNPLSTLKQLPEVDTLLDPCLGECCKRLDLTGRPACPSKASSARLQCMPIGVLVELPGCMKPDNFDCSRRVKKSPCSKPLAPFPSFSECKKDRLKQLKYRECSVSTKKTRAFAEMRSLGIPITVKNIEEGRCQREGVVWNCGADGRKGFFCKPTGTVLECSTLSLKERQLIAEQKCKNPKRPCNDY